MNGYSQGIIAQINNLSCRLIEETSVSLREYIIEKYIPYFKTKSRKDCNLKRDLLMIQTILSYDVVNIGVNKITQSDIVLLLALIEKDRKIAKATVNRYRARLSSIFCHAIQNRFIDFNPVKFIKKYKEYPRERYLYQNEALSLLYECKNSKNKELYTIVVLALNTGMRVGEILNLSRQNILEKQILLFGEQTKSGLPRRIPLNVSAKNVLIEHLNTSLNNDGLIFTSKDIRECFKYAKLRAGIIGLRFHDLRRTFATYLKDGNIDIHTISKILGHTSITTTERYLGVNQTKLLDSVQILSFT